jgi:hypothetical protein
MCLLKLVVCVLAKGMVLLMDDKRVISDISIGSESVWFVPESHEECRLVVSKPLTVIAL